jgi:serine/threonine-protein kinase
MVQSETRIGQTVAGGRYRLVRQIGRGSFGDVFLADQLRPELAGQPAVLKVLHAQWAEVPQVLERFRRESQVTAKIDHPHVARVFEHGLLEDGVPFIAMEYLPGRSLREELLRGRLELPRAVAILAPICEALGAAHRAGVVHRDLKPENIQLVERGGQPDVPVVLDFGVAKFLDAAEKLTMTGAVLGTPAYMPPEQFRGEQDLGPPADVYALGVLAFELCTGRPPFVGRNFAELAAAHTTRPAPPLLGVPQEVARVVAKCLDKDPSHRPRAEVLAWALRSASTAELRVASPFSETVVATTAVLPDLALQTVVSNNTKQELQSQRQKRERQMAAVLFAAGGVLAAILGVLLYLMLQH